MEVNNNDILYFENKNISNEIDKFKIDRMIFEQMNDEELMDPFQVYFNKIRFGEKKRLFTNKVDTKGPQFDFRESLGLSFKMNS